MILGELLNIEPSEIKFPFELKKEISSTVHLSNVSESHVAFKVFTTNPKKYWVQPKTGVVLPRSTCDIVVYMQAQNESPPDMLCTDKFMIQSMVANHLIKAGEEAAEMSTRESRLVYEYKLKVVYVPPQQQCASLNVRSKSFPSRQSSAEEKWSGSEVSRAVSDIKDKLSETCIGKLIKIVPSLLKFPFELNREMSCSLQLTNITENRVAFKVKTTNPGQYSVRPNMGIILPQATCDITVRMQAQKEFPSNMQCKDKFVIQSVITSSSETLVGINPEMFNKEAGHHVEDHIFPVAFVSSPLSVHLVNEELEGYLEASVVKNGNLSGSKVIETLFSNQDKSFKVNIFFPSGAFTKNSASSGDEEMSIGDLLTVKPPELKFPVKLNKRVSCSLHLTNKTESHVAFKVRATSPAKYIVQPSAGFISPHSTFDVVVTLLPQKRVPPDFQSQEKFLLQCLVAIPGSTSKDAMRDLFAKEVAHVRECKLRVAYILSDEPHLPAAEVSKESSSEAAPLVQNGESSQPQSSVVDGSTGTPIETMDPLQNEQSHAVQNEQSSRPNLPDSEESRGSPSPVASEEKNEQSNVSEPDSNGRPVNPWAIFCAVVVLLGVLSSLSGNLIIKMLPVMMKTLLEMVSEMIGDWVVKALVVVCFQLIFGYHVNNNN